MRVKGVIVTKVLEAIPIEPIKGTIEHIYYYDKRYPIAHIKRDGKVIEHRIVEAFNRDYARGLADMIESSENCIVTVKKYKDEQIIND